MELKFEVFFYDGKDYSTGEMLTAEQAFAEGFINFHGNALEEGDECSIIRMFTGLKDGNGKEIYEGDIVKALIYSDETPQILEVQFSNTVFIINYEDSESEFTPLGWFPGTIEIIGNIYENPELLE